MKRNTCCSRESVRFRDHFSNRHELVGVSRAVCRTACSKIFENDCSGFLYSRRTQSCTLSPYTGDWLMSSDGDCDPQSGLEFFRRIRSSGGIHWHCRMQCFIMFSKVCKYVIKSIKS